MSRFVALTTIRDRVISLCDLPATLDTTTPVTAVQILDFLQTSATLLSGIVSAAPNAQFHFAETTELTAVASVPAVSLPTEATNVLRVSWLKDSETDLILHPASLDDMRDRPTGWSDRQPTYRIVGQTLELFPTPTAAYTVKVYYSTGLYPDSINSSVWCLDGWDQFITMQTCCLVRARQQKACPEFEGPLLMLQQQLIGRLNRDKHGIRVCRDLRTAYEDNSIDPLWRR